MKGINGLFNQTKKNFFNEISKIVSHYAEISDAVKNLQTWVQGFGFLIQNTPTLLRFAAGAWLLQSVKATQCKQASGDYSMIYMNSTQDDSRLAINYSVSHYVLPILDNVCNFTLSTQPLSVYPEPECLCETATWFGGGHDISYKLILYDQNISENALNCIKKILEANCDELTAEDEALFLSTMGLILTAGLAYMGFIALRLCLYWNLKFCFYNDRWAASHSDPLRGSIQRNNGSRERKSTCSWPSRKDLNTGSLLVGLIGGLSAYGTGAIKGSQINDFFKLFNVSAEFLQHPAFLLLVLPIIPTINVWALHHNENQKALADITGYEFHGVSESVNLENIQPKPGQFYIKKTVAQEQKYELTYKVRHPTTHEVITWAITEDQLQQTIPNMVIDARFHIDKLRSHFPQLLSIINDSGHTSFNHPANRIRQLKQLGQGAYLQLRKEPTPTPRSLGAVADCVRIPTLQSVPRTETKCLCRN